ncbi:MAG: tRNA dihydrouridine synthase DusB [Xenophilus sp.]
MHIGPIALENRLFVAPMAGVTDRPFRMLCRALGAGYAVSEMVTSRKELWQSLKTSRRADHTGEPGPISVQIAGTDAAMMAEAARYNIDRGAQIIDINMGCPAKKVCSKWAGSALMRDEPLALQIAEAVVAAAAPHGVPVTLKMRTGWSAEHRNAEKLARDFERAGIQMLTVHGRTREQGYKGPAEYGTIAAVKSAVRIPVVANGDVDSPEKAREVFAATGADAVMVGRAAQGRPWIFREIGHFLATGGHLAPPLVAEVKRLLLEHLHEHHALYGDYSGVRTARKHIGWYVRALPGGEDFRDRMNRIEDARVQLRAVADFFDALGQRMDRLPASSPAVAMQDDEEDEAHCGSLR